MSSSTHRQKFFLKLNLLKKGNSRLINREDLEKAKLYLLSKQSDSDQTAELEISNSLKRRISRNKLRLARFGAGNDVVCILDERNSNATNTSMVSVVFVIAYSYLPLFLPLVVFLYHRPLFFMQYEEED